MANQPMLPKSHTNSADLTSRLPDGRSTQDRVKVARNEQLLKRSAPRAPVLYHRPIGRCFTTGLVKLPLGGAVLYPIFQENMIAAIVFFGLATSLALVYLALLLESDHD